MFHFAGNTSTIASTSVYNLPVVVKGIFSLVNKTAGAIGVNVYLISGVNQISLIPLNKQLASGETYESADREIVILASEQVKLQVSGSTDYYFPMDNTEAP